MKRIFCLLLLVLSRVAFANDSVYYFSDLQSLSGDLSQKVGVAQNHNTFILDNIRSSGTIYGASNDNNDTVYNKIVISSSDYNQLFAGYSHYGNASNNSIKITDSKTYSDAYGGFTWYNNSNDNTIVIDSSTIHSVIGGKSEYGYANNNYVEINNSMLISDYGYEQDEIYGGDGGLAARNNVVVINGGQVKAIVYGGKSEWDTGAAVNNAVIIKNAPIMTQASIIGGYSKFSTNNSLELYSKDLRASEVSMFQKYFFILPANIDDGDIMLSTVNPIVLDGAGVGVAFATGEDYTLLPQDSIILMDNAEGDFYKLDMNKENLKGTQGISLVYDFDLSLEDKQLKATVINKSAAEESKAPSEGVAASVAVLTASADVVAGAALENALSVAATSGVGNFGSISGGSYNYKTGSDVDVLGLSGVAGIAKAFDAEFGNAMAGFFVEAGYGKHETHNDFSFGSITGKGNSTYSGVGLLGYAEFEKMKGVYAEASMRLGMINSDWSSDDLGMDVSYSTGSMYYGLHLGAGYKNQLNDNLGYDLYAKYFFAHQNSNDVTISGDKFEFDAVNSHRVRLGSKLSLTSFEQINPYLGVAWEHEFDGEARATVYGLDVPAPTLAGDTGILEFGVKNTATEDSALSFEFAVQGYFGMRTGIGGILQGAYKF